MGELIAVTSGKGGTGKTSLCAAIATCLAAEGSKVLCIDCDVGLRNLDIALGMADDVTVSFLEVMKGTYTLDAAAQHPGIPGLSLLTAPTGLEPEEIDPELFAGLMRETEEKYDFCFLDAPAGLGAGFRLATRNAKRILLVSGADPASQRDAARTADELELSGIKNVKLIVNRVTGPMLGKMNRTVDDVMDEIGLPIIGVVPEDRNVTLAAAFSKPLIFATNRGAAAACLRIARRIRGLRVPLKARL